MKIVCVLAPSSDSDSESDWEERVRAEKERRKKLAIEKRRLAAEAAAKKRLKSAVQPQSSTATLPPPHGSPSKGVVTGAEPSLSIPVVGSVAQSGGVYPDPVEARVRSTTSNDGDRDQDSADVVIVEKFPDPPIVVEEGGGGLPKAPPTAPPPVAATSLTTAGGVAPDRDDTVATGTLYSAEESVFEASGQPGVTSPKSSRLLPSR